MTAPIAGASKIGRSRALLLGIATRNAGASKISRAFARLLIGMINPHKH